MSLCKGHRATHNKILLSVIWHGIVLSFNFSFSFFHQSYKIVLAIFNFLEKSQFQFSILFLVNLLRYFTVYSLVLILNILNWLILKSFCSTVAHLEQITQDCLSHEYLYPKVSI